MYVKINRNTCDAHLAFCERCLGRFLTYPMGYERRCFEILEDDGKPELTIDLHSGDQNVTLVLDDDMRKMVAGEGWAAFSTLSIPQYREKLS